MSGRYQEGYVAGYKKGMEDGADEVEPPRPGGEMSDRSKVLRSKLCIEDVCQLDDGCGCLEAIDEALVPLRAEIERLTVELANVTDEWNIASKAESQCHELRAEIERLQEQVRNRDYALDRLGELKDAEIERLLAENRWLYDQLASQREAYRELVSRCALGADGAKAQRNL